MGSVLTTDHQQQTDDTLRTEERYEGVHSLLLDWVRGGVEEGVERRSVALCISFLFSLLRH